jgi:hypothetical protein
VARQERFESFDHLKRHLKKQRIKNGPPKIEHETVLTNGVEVGTITTTPHGFLASPKGSWQDKYYHTRADAVAYINRKAGTGGQS